MHHTPSSNGHPAAEMPAATAAEALARMNPADELGPDDLVPWGTDDSTAAAAATVGGGDDAMRPWAYALAGVALGLAFAVAVVHFGAYRPIKALADAARG